MVIREEIISGLQNAIARGDSLEHAMQTFVSAGYPPDDVTEAAKNLNMGLSGKVSQAQPNPSQIKVSTSTQVQTSQEGILPFQETPKKKSHKGIIIIIVILVILLAGIIGISLFGEDLLSTLFPPG